MKRFFTFISGILAFLFLFVDISSAQTIPESFVKGCPSVFEILNAKDGTPLNAISKGNWVADGADTEGRLAVGGNFTVKGGYSIGSGNGTNKLTQSNGKRDDLIVGGNFTNHSNWQIPNGNAVYGGSFSGTPPSFGGTGNQLVHDSAANPNRFDFAAAFSTFEDISEYLASLPQNGTVEDNGYGNVKLTGTDPELNVFEINSSMMKNWGMEVPINVPSSSTVIINVRDNTFTLPGGSFIQPNNIRERVLINFTDATEINFSNVAVEGSVLAPYANFTGKDSNVNGQMVIGGDVYQTGGFEPHHYPFKGCIKIPEKKKKKKKLTITEGPCWRMLASPFKRRSYDGGKEMKSPGDFTYNHLIGEWWTQGVPGSDYPHTSESNIFLWEWNASGNTAANWTTSGLNLNNQIPGGKGFLMSVFTDDEFGTPGSWNKTVSFTYNSNDIYPAPFTASVSNGNLLNNKDDGWSLLGNPFDEGIKFDKVAAASNGITGVAYVYDRNYGGSGGWRTTNGSFGDIKDNIIAVFQGFFVQNDNNTAAGQRKVVFTEDSKAGTDGVFYGKEMQQKFVRLELHGEGLFNSAWVELSEEGSFERLYGDAWELEPFTEQYALLGTQKSGDMFDIAKFPAQNGTEIPLSVETTLSGEFTLSATDIQIPPGINLVFVDKERNISLPVDEHFSYSFTANAARQKGLGTNALPCGATEQQIAEFFHPQQAKTSGNSRFVLVVNPENENNGMAANNLPATFELLQNYPNPFNPATQITYQLPQASQVYLGVYDMAGRQVATLVDHQEVAGSHTINFDASGLSSGVYLYRLQAGTTVLTRKLTLIK